MGQFDNRDHRSAWPEPKVSDPTQQEQFGISDLSTFSFVRPAAAVTLEPAKKDQSLETETVPGAQPKSFFQSLKHAAYTAINSAAVWSGSGAAVVCLVNSIVGVIGHAISTAITLRNELRQNAPEQRAAPAPDSIWRNGVLGVIRDAAMSPGLNMIIGGFAYMVATVQAVAQGRPDLALAFGAFLIGQASVTALSNANFTGQREKNSSIEKTWHGFWKNIPERLQNLFRNPAPWYSVGNMALVVPSFKVAEFATSPVTQGLIATGLLIVSASLAKTVINLFKRDQGDKPGGGDCYMLGLGGLVMGAALLIQGSYAIAAANLLWGVADILWGRDLNAIKSSESGDGKIESSA